MSSALSLLSQSRCLCLLFPAGIDDVTLSRCLDATGSQWKDTRDAEGKERFMVFRPDLMILGSPPNGSPPLPDWYLQRERLHGLRAVSIKKYVQSARGCVHVLCPCMRVFECLFRLCKFVWPMAAIAAHPSRLFFMRFLRRLFARALSAAVTTPSPSTT